MRTPSSLSSLKSIIAELGVEADSFSGYDLLYGDVVIGLISVEDQWVIRRPDGVTIYDTKELQSNLKNLVAEFKNPL